MDTVKAAIRLGDASIELEGPQEFVEKYLDQYRSLIEIWRQLPKSREELTKTSEAVKPVVAPRKRVRGKKPAGAPGCTTRIRTLISENYFAQPKVYSEVLNYLKDEKGVTYSDKPITSSLLYLVKQSELRRFKEGKTYKYTNP